ncbi:MAG: hypothetical protein HWE25_14250 [Alphaproteobacteria bacterium]|nr:hypothetical protein [Alphaproteobacteria bacterium]
MLIRPIFVASLFASIQLPAQAQAEEEDKARIQLLEDQVVQLQAEIRKLGDIIDAMQVRLNQVGNDIHTLQRGERISTATAIQECYARRNDLIQKRDMLRSTGLKDGHPDMKNISKLIDALHVECASQE